MNKEQKKVAYITGFLILILWAAAFGMLLKGCLK